MTDGVSRVRSFLVTLADWGRRDLYMGGAARTVAQSLGVEDHLGVAYWRALSATAGSTRTVRVGGASARFHVGSPAELQACLQTAAREHQVLADLLPRLRPDDVVWDVGANVGLYTCLAADRLVEGEGGVVAVEPHPLNADRVGENLARNDFDGHVVECALSDARGEAPFAYDAHVGAQGGRLDVGRGGTRRLTVRTERGDDLVSDGGVPAPTVLKVDVEGAEEAVLAGLERTLDRPTCRLVYCELHYGDDTVVHTLADHGFTVETIHHDTTNQYVRATR
ncbi:FkbM family methyltransferase [Halomarina litorea]|uniref:FkbM family methyltransferase n=1 Tax=Halomarina litorea TaxID=2961595 RepID=UPI0020C2101E|nr:FkbM family methyltransferase [Halomarina sp. BCD28]